MGQEITTFKKTREQARRDFEDMLIDAYLDGFAEVLYLLGEDIFADPAKASSVTQKTYDGKSVIDKFVEYYDAKDAENIVRLVDSEFHRANEQGGYDAAVASDRNIKKRWTAILDDKTRFTHDMLDGTKVGLNDYFYSLSGDRALFPGGFETAEENTNCRCTTEYFAE